MKPSTAHGLWLLGLLCFLPRANAVSVTLLTDNRSMAISGFRGTTTIPSQTLLPSAPFADFSGALSGGGISITHASTVTSTFFQSVGSYRGSVTPGVVENDQTSAIYDITFRLDSAALFDFWSYREVGIFGINDITLRRVGSVNSVFTFTGPTPVGNIFQVNGGLLQAGTYNITVNSAVGVGSIGSPRQDDTFGRYAMSLSLRDIGAVPEHGETWTLLLTAVGCLLVWERKTRAKLRVTI